MHDCMERYPVIPLATDAMHPAQSWRDGYNDAVRGRSYGNTRHYTGDSGLLYADGYSCGSVRRGEFFSQRKQIATTP